MINNMNFGDEMVLKNSSELHRKPQRKSGVYEVNPSDLAAAVKFLEKTSFVQSWTITRIKNKDHAVPPIGQGFGILVVASRNNETIRVWEKVGGDLSILAVASKAIVRLKISLDGLTQNR